MSAGWAQLAARSSSRGAASLVQLCKRVWCSHYECDTPEAVQLSVSCSLIHSIPTWRKPLLPPPLHEVPGSALAQLLHAAG